MAQEILLAMQCKIFGSLNMGKAAEHVQGVH
ncbi:hypothetical protein PSPPH_2389 [Pseudomonas savastanoi pv. phaseolicola 1448A]|uniref:Uncharacterized protein n=1 Tax=Pseudomonas savastanoi pv. phaseolicola (strain 1448A / Race 6) TaxID=264730 RepID=Q48J42_PSE14|nr:hypothetical protein PSPPH_2389 [Pseudomonas savastanoi pv. phaseolicola 1448A]